MKISGIILCLFLCAPAFAGSVAVPRLPPPEYLDTEVSTNVVFSLPEKADMFTMGRNMLKAVTRGVGVHGETFAVTHTTYGTRLIWR